METPGLSQTSAHRPGDIVSGPLLELDAGGTTRLVVDTTLSYLTPSNFDDATFGSDPAGEVRKAEQKKRAEIQRDLRAGSRAPLPAGYEFVPAAMDPRGQSGPGMVALLERIARHGAAHSHGLSSDDGADGAYAKLLARCRTRLAIAMQRALMEEYLHRAQRVATAAAERSGTVLVTNLELRFQR